MLAAVWLPVAAVAAERQGPVNISPTVLAQSGPVRLVPRERVAPAAGPQGEQALPAYPLESAPSVQTPHRSIQNIEVNALSGPEPDEAGSLYADNGGFGGALWEGMPRDLIGRLIQRLPATTQSPAMRDIVRRLLLTAASLPPRGDEGGASLIVSRVERLQAMGLLGSSSELADVAPNRNSDQNLQRLRAENFLLRNDVGGACGEAARQPLQPGDLFWQKLLIYCQAIQGDTAGASLGSSLLVETGQLDDPAYLTLVDQLVSGNATVVDSLVSPTPLLLSLMRTANIPVPADALERATPPQLGLIGSSPNTTIEIRLEAAERAALYGSMTADRLAEVYASVAFSTDDLDNALSIADVTRTPRGRALLYQAALVHAVPAARAAVVQKALALAHEDGRYALIVHVYETLLTGLSPSNELIWFAADASRALFALDRADLAQRWRATLRQEAARDPEFAIAADSLWAIATLAETGQNSEATIPAPESRADPVNAALAAAAPTEAARPAFGGVQRGVVVTTFNVLPKPSAPALPVVRDVRIDPAGAAAWRAALHNTSPDTAANRIADAFMLLSAAGIIVDDDEFRALLGDSGPRMTVSPDPAYRTMLARASKAGRRGETILIAALMLGESGVAELDTTASTEIVLALRLVGLPQEARKLAIEIAVQAGL